MPQALSKREAAVGERIIRTAAMRPDVKAPDNELWLKLFSRLATKGITKGDLDLIHGSKVADSQQARFCSVMAALYREAAALPQKGGAIILRSLVSAR
jgi:hypothetical protein